MNRLWTIILAALTIGVSGIPPMLRSQDMPVPVSLQTEVLWSVISFERNHHDPMTQGTTIAILYQGNFRHSHEAFLEARTILLKKESPDMLTIREIDIDRQTLEEAIIAHKPHVLIVCPVRGVSVGDIAAACRKYAIMSASLVPDYLDDGISIGIELEHNRPLIVVNQTAMQSENTNFDARLLKMVRMRKQ